MKRLWIVATVFVVAACSGPQHALPMTESELLSGFAEIEQERSERWGELVIGCALFNRLSPDDAYRSVEAAFQGV